MATMRKVDTRYKYILSITQTSTGQFDTYNDTKKTKKASEITNYILDALSTEYTQQAFANASRIFHGINSVHVNNSAWWW